MTAHIVFTATVCIALSCAPVEVHVLDGDTIEAAGTRYRLEDIDAPEIRGRCDAERRLALQSRKRLAELLRGEELKIQPGDLDRYGRTLAIVSVAGSPAAATLIAEGLAVPWAGRRHDWC